jgi:hypothetical protein
MVAIWRISAARGAADTAVARVISQVNALSLATRKPDRALGTTRSGVARIAAVAVKRSVASASSRLRAAAMPADKDTGRRNDQSRRPFCLNHHDAFLGSTAVPESGPKSAQPARLLRAALSDTHRTKARKEGADLLDAIRRCCTFRLPMATDSGGRAVSAMRNMIFRAIAIA